MADYLRRRQLSPAPYLAAAKQMDLKMLLFEKKRLDANRVILRVERVI